MRVFVTGASGHIASELIPELLSAGHAVTGLARSDRSAAAVKALGADVRRGGLGDHEALEAGAREADAVVHLAFDHGRQRSGDLDGAVAADLDAIRTIGEALRGSGKAFIGTNATGAMALAGFSGLLTEDDVLPGGPRVDAENRVIALADHGVRAVVVRLPPTVHSNGRFGFVSAMIGIARATGTSGRLGDGTNRWPSADTRDVARLYRLAVQSAAPGTRLHAVAEEGIALRDIADVLADRLGLHTAEIAPGRAAEHFGFLAPFVAADSPAASRKTRDLLGWSPAHPGLLAHLRQDPALAPAAG